MAGHWWGVGGGSAKERRTLGEGLVRKREGLARKWAEQRSMGHLLEEGHCEEERILAQQR